MERKRKRKKERKERKYLLETWQPECLLCMLSREAPLGNLLSPPTHS